MTLTKDQKRALMIGGGIIAVIILWMLFGRKTAVIPTAQDVKETGSYPLDAPGYTTYNVQPLSIPAPGISNMEIPGVTGCGCASKTDGCFTSNPLDTGQGPLSVSQLLATYGAAFPEFLQLVQKSQEGYAVPDMNIGEMAAPASNCYPIGYNVFGARDRFAALSNLASQCWSPSVNGF